jgi:hypothetical protein
MGRKKRRSPEREAPSHSGLVALSVRDIPAPAAAVLFAAWAGTVLYFYYTSFQAPFLNPGFWLRFIPAVWRTPAPVAAGHALKFGLFSLYAVYCLGIGRGLLRKAFRVSGLNPLETAGIAYALGLGAVGLGTLGLGIFGILSPAPVFAAAFAGLIWAGWANSDVPEIRVSLRPTDLWPEGFSRVFGAAAGALLLFQLYHALAPDIFYDSLVYHLALPHLYRLEGGLVATPTNLYSGLPMLVQWNYAFLLFFGDEISAKLVQWGCACAITAGIAGLGLRLKRPAIGWTAAVIFLGTPMVLYNVVRAGVDVGSSCLILLAVHAAGLQFRAEEEGVEGPVWAVSAALAGLALGVKYPNWTVLPALLAVQAALGAPRRRVALYAALALALLTPWVVKNLWLYGNPIFPYFHDFLNPGAEFQPPWRVLHASGWGREWGKILSDPGELWRTLAHPWYASVHGKTEFDHIGPFYIIALLPLAWHRPEGKASRFWLWSLFGLWMLWWPLTRMPRFFMPGLCVFAVVVALLVHAPKSRWLRWFLSAALLGLTADGVAMYLAITGQSDAYAYLIGGTPKEEYLGHTRRTYPASYYRAARWLDKNAPEDARVLLVGGGRGFYWPRPFLASTQYDPDLFSRWLQTAKTPDALYGTLREKGITHLAVNMAWTWRGDPKEGTGEERANLLDAFAKRRLKYVFGDVHEKPPRWILVYELVDDAGGETPSGFDEFSRWYRIGGRSALGID